MLRRLLGLGIIILVVCLNPASLQAKDLKVNLTDPDRPGMVGTGNTVSTVLSIPTVAYGENQVLGTVRITGKPGIRVPLQEGQKIMAELDPGVCYMCTPTPENYRDYIDWPAIIDGQTNQITDQEGEPGIRFLSGTPRSLTIQIANLNSQSEVMVVDFHFNKEHTSAVRVARFAREAEEYLGEPSGTVTRQRFFDMLAGIVIPFHPDFASYVDRKGLVTLERFSDLTVDLESIDAELIGIKPLVDAGYLIGNEQGQLRKDASITRAEAVNLVGRLFPGEGMGIEFRDSLPDWAVGITAASANHIVTGYPDGTFRPDQLLSQQEALTILQKAFETYSKVN